MKQQTFVAVGFSSLAAFTAGWLLRPLQLSEQTNSGLVLPGSTQVVQAAPLAKSSLTTPTVENELTAQPFRSLAEVVEFFQEAGLVDEESLGMADGLQRLLATQAGDLARIAEELSQHGASMEDGQKELISGAILFRWMLADSRAATEFALVHQSEELFADLAPLTVLLAANRNPQDVDSLVARLPEEQRLDVMEKLQMGRAVKAPKAFLTDPKNAQVLLDDSNLLEAALGSWTRRSPVEATAWLASLPESQRSASAYRSVADSWVKMDRNAVIAWSQTLPDGDQKEAVIAGITNHLGMTVPEKDWASALKDLPATLADSLEFEMIKNAPANAWEEKLVHFNGWLARHPESEEGSAPAENLASHQYDLNKTAAELTNWIEQMPDGPAQLGASKGLLDKWAVDDPEAASKWVASLPPGSELRDSAAAALVGQIHEQDPASALTWSLSLKNSDLRQQALKSVFIEWLPKRPYEAIKALEALPAEVRKEIKFKDAIE